MSTSVRFGSRSGLRWREVVSYRSLRLAQLRAHLRCHERKVYSQNGEDGLLEYIFSSIGTTTRRFVEIGCETGVECNTAHLSLVHSWSGLLIDANASYITQARAYYQQQLGTQAYKVALRATLATVDNINDTIAEYTQGKVDLLSIDVDGVDYYLWQAITVIGPRVVVIEYNASLPPLRPMAVRYDPTFERFHYHPSGYYHGASLGALANLAQTKGYVLVGCDSEGVNAFFVKESEVGTLAQLTPAQAYYPCRYRLWQERRTLEDQYALTGTMYFVEV